LRRFLRFRRFLPFFETPFTQRIIHLEIPWLILSQWKTFKNRKIFVRNWSVEGARFLRLDAHSSSGRLQVKILWTPEDAAWNLLHVCETKFFSSSYTHGDNRVFASKIGVFAECVELLVANRCQRCWACKGKNTFM
jgi:hypothetical protein